MSSTFQLQKTVSYASQTIRQAPLVDVGGITNEPAFSIGNWVKQFILAAPFAWRWNRVETSYAITTGGNDVVESGLTNFGWLEKAYWVDSSVSPNVVQQLQIANNLLPDFNQNLPVTISPVLDDGSGDITFRTTPASPKNLTVFINYQKAAVNFQNLTDTWAPIPDYLYYLIETGFLAKTYEYLNDPRFGATMQMFVKQVIAANAGIADSQENIYLTEFINTERQIQSQLGNSQSGRAGRGLFQ